MLLRYGNTDVEQIRNKSQHRKLTPEKKISRRSCRDSNPRPFSHESGALTTELYPLPNRILLSLSTMCVTLSDYSRKLTQDVPYSAVISPYSAVISPYSAVISPYSVVGVAEYDVCDAVCMTMAGS